MAKAIIYIRPYHRNGKPGIISGVIQEGKLLYIIILNPHNTILEKLYACSGLWSIAMMLYYISIMKQKIILISLILLILLTPAILFASSGTPEPMEVPEEEEDTIKDTLEKLETLYRLIDEIFLFDIDHEAVYESMAKGLFSALEDPYSEYITAEESQDIQDLTQGIYGGIGAYISKPNPSYIDYNDPETYMVTIVAPFLGSPAYKAGLHAGDLIAEIDGIKVKIFLTRKGVNGAWHTIISTNTNLTFNRMIEIYNIRWTIEVFFKEAKQLLGLGKSQSTNFDVQVAQTTITMIPFLLVSLKYII